MGPNLQRRTKTEKKSEQKMQKERNETDKLDMKLPFPRNCAIGDAVTSEIWQFRQMIRDTKGGNSRCAFLSKYDIAQKR